MNNLIKYKDILDISRDLNPEELAEWDKAAKECFRLAVEDEDFAKSLSEYINKKS
jgi:hypothetical protein